MTLSVAEFARRLRAKYPGEYDSLSDDDLARRVAAKYPEYNSEVEFAPAPSVATQTVTEKPARVATPTLDAQGLTSAEVKRRAAAGEPIAGGERHATATELLRSAGVNASAGLNEGAIQGLLMPADVDPKNLIPRIPAIIQGAREGGLGGAFSAALPATTAVTRLTDKVIPVVRRAVGVPDVAITEDLDAMARLAGNVVAPGPEVAAMSKLGGRGARVLERAPSVAAKAEKVVEKVAPLTDHETHVLAAKIAKENGWDVSAIGRGKAGDPALPPTPPDLWKEAQPAIMKDGKVYAKGENHAALREQLGIKPKEKNGVWQEDWPNVQEGEIVRGEFISVADLDRHKGDLNAAYAEKVPPAEAPMQVNAANPIPSVADVAKVAKKFGPVKEMVDAINPTAASPEAAAAADILKGSKAEIANAASIERFKYRPASRLNTAVRDLIGKPLTPERQAGTMLARESKEAGEARISNYERTGTNPNMPPGYNKMYAETTNAAHEMNVQTYGEDRVGYVENYVRRAFKFKTAADEAKATGVLSNWVGSLSANKSPLKGRVLDVPLDEALATMRSKGISVEPVTTNMEVLRQWTIENANQARVYKQAWEEAKAGKLIHFVKNGEKIPANAIALDDRVAKVFRPTPEGAVQTGRYYAEPGVARIFNNAISKGLGDSPTFRAIRTMNNAYNQMQLGLSAFHLTGTAINAGISDLSLGMQQIFQGDIKGAAVSIGRSAVPAYSFARDMYRGNSIIKGLLENDPLAKKFLDERLNPAGGRLAVDAGYRNAAAENMRKAWADRRILAAVGNAPLAIVQKISSPLMEYAIPRVKVGAFMDLAEAQLQKLGPGASPADRARALQMAWNSIDNRFGQLVHDNLFWNRTAADLAQVSTRSVGWNLGTIREIGGGGIDVAKGRVSPRVLYSAALPIYAGTIGAVYQYLHTGKMPAEMRDYFYPQNGLKDKGKPDRVSLPTYMKDVFSYSSHPVLTLEHKASPLLSMAVDLASNKDFYGDMIRNPEETKSKQWQQMGTYALKQFQPFSIQQLKNVGKEGATPEQAAESFMGFTKAPLAMRLSDKENRAMEEKRRRMNEAQMRHAAKKRAARGQ